MTLDGYVWAAMAASPRVTGAPVLRFNFDLTLGIKIDLVLSGF